MQEQGPYEGDGSLADNPSLTRQALRAQAEELAVELARWKVWRVEGHAHENLQEAQAMQALAMVLVELLDNVHGSHAAVHTELARQSRCWGTGCKLVALRQPQRYSAPTRTHQVTMQSFYGRMACGSVRRGTNPC